MALSARPSRCAGAGAAAVEQDGDGDHPAVPAVRAERAWRRALFVALAGDPGPGAHPHPVHGGTLVALTVGGDPEAVAEGRRAVRLAPGGRARRGFRVKHLRIFRISPPVIHRSVGSHFRAMIVTPCGISTLSCDMPPEIPGLNDFRKHTW
ncbi:hypothetical protein CNX65_24435 [Actinosynnema pretiosum]|uniref:Uncharacterized protein n=1 Tax=Actinosynnema pretiosum TaxID=42197 RepID=A0A290ZAM1_9PSEU|nr:hypothetical protein CNX65_24435 [Actinosynnema pretiosum]